MTTTRKLEPVSFKNVRIADAFWAPRIETNRKVTIPIEYDQCKKTGRIDAFDAKWKGAKRSRRHRFWDSDVAKWIEAAAYVQATRPDVKAARTLEAVIRKVMGAQQADGYLNMYYTYVEPENRWKNVRDWHELYCAGHLMEAAVAYYDATGKRDFLDAMCRYADYIDSVFGGEKGKKRGYPGHQEIELALVKLYRATGEERYLKLAKFFIDERGRKPHYYHIEAKARGEKLADWYFKSYRYCQAHLPVRDQKDAVGHAVRALYMYCGMVDVAVETGDAALLRACERLWRSICERRMLITGGVGTSPKNEGFTYDYDMPEETAYAETCAAVSNVFFNHRLLQVTGDAKYADVMERALYNGVLSGVSLDGTRFFYSNPLASHEPLKRPSRDATGETWDGLTRHRQEWFGCACCPPNIARLLAGLGEYVYSESRNAAWVHLYIAGSADLKVGAKRVKLTQETKYPWNGKIRIRVTPEKPSSFSLNLRIPEWCRRATLKVAGKKFDVRAITRKGYARIKRTWKPGDVVELELDMPIERVYANPEMRQLEGRVALQRGPVVYCLETVDNVTNTLDRIGLPENASLRAVYKKDLLGGVAVIEGRGALIDDAGWKGRLYEAKKPKTKTVRFTAVPYCVWDNRAPGSMRVWMRSE